MGLILAIDPGKTSGVVLARGVYETEELTILHAEEIVWSSRQAQTQRIITDFAAQRATETLDAIVVEEFVLYPNKAAEQGYNDFPSVRMIGIIETYAYENAVDQLIVYQRANLRKSTQIPAAIYKQLNAHGRAHMRDAYQHLRYYFLMRARKLGKYKRS